MMDLDFVSSHANCYTLIQAHSSTSTKSLLRSGHYLRTRNDRLRPSQTSQPNVFRASDGIDESEQEQERCRKREKELCLSSHSLSHFCFFEEGANCCLPVRLAVNTLCNQTHYAVVVIIAAAADRPSRSYAADSHDRSRCIDTRYTA